MKQLFLFITLCVFTTTFLSGQLTLDKLDLSNYVPGEQRYRTVDYSLSTVTDDQQFSSNLLGNIAPGLNLTRYRNTSKKQVEHNAYLDLKTNRSKGIHLTASYAYRSRLYLLSSVPKLFTDFKVSISGQSNLLSHTQVSTNLNLGLGYGRTYIVNEIEIAERILKSTASLLGNQTSASNAEIGRLADFLTELKQNRYVTNRSNLDEEFKLLKNKLLEWGYWNQDVEEEIDNEIFKIFRAEPLIRREHGRTLALSTGRFSSVYRNVVGDSDNYTGNVSLTFSDKTYINSNVQWNNLVFANLTKVDTRVYVDDFYLPINYFKATQLRIGISSEFHFLSDQNTRYTLKPGAYYTQNYDVEGVFESEGTMPLQSGFGVNLGLEYEKRFSRNFRASFGLDLNYDNRGLSSGAGVKLTFYC